MKYTLKIPIECGKKTCASKPGKFCSLFQGGMTNKNFCHIFGRVFDKDGWVQRHPACLKMARADAKYSAGRTK